MDKNIEAPIVTVLMPVYNGEKYLKEAIDSILSQSFKDFEFLIIDDGSSDKSAEIIKSYIDGRIKYVSNIINKGLPYSLNRGIELARGEYIARMDQDDISLLNRIEEQVDFMQENRDIGICGTWIKTIGNKPGYVHKFYTDSNDIKASLLFNTSLAHPSVVIRKSVLYKNNLRYHTEHLHFEDYSLWVELSQYSELANLSKVLLFYRVHKSSVSHVYTTNQKMGAYFIRKTQLEKLGLSPNEEDMRIHNSLYPKKGESLKDFLEKEMVWLIKIIDTNKQTSVYKQKSLSKIIYARWYLLCMANANGGLIVWKKFRVSALFQFGTNKRIIDSLKIFLKTSIKR